VRTFKNPSDKTKHNKICNAQQHTPAITDDDKLDEKQTPQRIKTCASSTPIVGGSKPATCRICPHFYATSHKQLMGHFAELHPHERPFKCDMCTRTFIEDNKRRKHERDECKGIMSAPSTPQSTTIQPAADTSTPIDASIAIVTPDVTVNSLVRVVPPAQAVACRLCALMCDSHRRLGDHFKQMHIGIMPFACTRCTVATFKKDFQRRIHETKCMLKNTVAAAVSTPSRTHIYPTPATSQLKKHAEPAPKRRPHRKSPTVMKTTDDDVASENEQQHHWVKCLKNDCQLRFANTEELLRHVGAAHLNNNARSTAKCPRCPMTCVNDTLLKAHLTTHNQIDIIDLD
jgi:hypothetical protein